VCFCALFVFQERLSEWISELQERSENIEDLVSELELGYNTVEVGGKTELAIFSN
jgi:hypothetical protein